MSRLTKRALYNLACGNRSNSFSTPVVIELPLNSVSIVPVDPRSGGLPDGRLSNKLGAGPTRTSNDSIRVSHRAVCGNSSLAVRRIDVLQKLGSGSLGHLTNAYFEQQRMGEDEIHCKTS